VILLSTQNILFADTIKVVCSICCATDSTLAQYDIDSIHIWCAADFMKLNADESQQYSVD